MYTIYPGIHFPPLAVTILSTGNLAQAQRVFNLRASRVVCHFMRPNIWHVRAATRIHVTRNRYPQPAGTPPSDIGGLSLPASKA